MTDHIAALTAPLRSVILRAGLVALAAAALVAVAPASTRASVYYVHECGNGIGVPASETSTSSDDGRFGLSNQCANSNIGLAAYPIADVGTSVAGRAGKWVWTAPPGTSIQGVTGRHILRHNNGFAAKLRIVSPTSLIDIVRNAGADVSMVSFNPFVWSPFSLPIEPARTFEEVVACEAASCSHSGVDTAAYIKELTFNVDDYLGPSAAVGGSLFSGGWKSDADTVEYSGADAGSGVRYLDTYVNGSLWRRDAAACSTAVLDGRLVATRMSPCPASSAATHSADTASAPFQEGENRVEQCTEDFGGIRSCAPVRSVSIDNLPPSAPVGLALASGSSWRNDNTFELRWTNPVQGAGAPIAGVHYRVGDGPDHYVPGGNIASLDEIQLPGDGRHTVKVWLEDAAGHSDEATAATVTVGLDGADPQTSISGVRDGWATDDVSIQLQAADALSGIGSLHWAVDGGPEQESTGSAAINLREEGDHLIAYHATDNAGNVEERIEQTVRIDRTPPDVSISGVRAGWSREPVAIVIDATDALSGMSGDVSRVERAAYTAVRVDDGQWHRFAGGRARLEVSSDGVHTVSYFARDLAGKQSPVSARQVRVDRAAPLLGFAAEQNPDRPTEVRAPVSDAVSGVAGGEIAYRAAGLGQAWSALPTSVDAGRGHAELVADFPADDLPRGRFEFRATAVDNAGNRTETGLRVNGTPMVLSNPVKVETVLDAAIEVRKPPRRGRVSRPRRIVRTRKAIVKYSSPVVIAGSLRTRAGRPLAGSRIHFWVTQRSGAARVISRSTDPRGRFRLRLPAGPSRTVRAVYAGTVVLSRSRAKPLRVFTRAGARLRVSPRAVRNLGRIRLTGAVGRRLAAIPRRGKLVALQFLDVRGGSRRWRPVALVHTDGRGRFTHTYRFRHIRRQERITFRAAVLPDGNWPYAFGASKPVRIVARP
jgi:hypothetical protein